jgi:hypothetical protein
VEDSEVEEADGHPLILIYLGRNQRPTLTRRRPMQRMGRLRQLRVILCASLAASSRANPSSTSRRNCSQPSSTNL